jgi:anti-anti-sigma factor
MAQLVPVPTTRRTCSMSAQLGLESKRQRTRASSRASTLPSRDASAFALDWELPRQLLETRGTSYWSPVGDPRREPVNSPGDRAQPPNAPLAIAIRRCLGTVVVTLVGPLDALAVTGLAATLDDLIDGQGNLMVAVDLSGVRRISPSGLQVLSAAASHLERRGGHLSLCEAPDGALHTLQLAGLGRFIGGLIDKADRRATSGAGGRSLTRAKQARGGRPSGRERQVAEPTGGQE